MCSLLLLNPLFVWLALSLALYLCLLSCSHFDCPHSPCRTHVGSLHIPLIAPHHAPFDCPHSPCRTHVGSLHTPPPLLPILNPLQQAQLEQVSQNRLGQTPILCLFCFCLPPACQFRQLIAFQMHMFANRATSLILSTDCSLNAGAHHWCHQLSRGT